MNVEQLIQGIKNGKIAIDLGGHQVFSGVEGILNKIIDIVQWHQAYFANKANPQNKDGVEYKTMLDGMESESCIVVGEPLPYYCSCDVVCSLCGENSLKMFLKTEELLTVGNFIYSGQKAEVLEKPCLFKDGLNPFETLINLPTGTLLFGNFFAEIPDCSKEDKYTSAWDLNHERGRRNIAQYLADQQCGYLQAGGFNVYIYRHKIRDELIISKCDIFETEECGYLPIPEANSYSLMGAISCEKWRVMWCDIFNLASRGFKKLDESYVEVQVSAGNWKCTDLYNCDGYKDEQPVIARIVRVEV